MFKKVFFTLHFTLFAILCATAQCIDRVAPYKDGKVVITSPEKLFSGCQMRLCRHNMGQGQAEYAIELDLTDKTEHVCQGDLFTIHFKDGSRISMTNMWDTEADLTHESYIDTQQHTYTDIVPVYDGWYDAIYSVPVTGVYTEHVPVDRTTSFLSLFYMISEKDIDKIIQGNVSQVSIVTDEQTIVKKARGISDKLSGLYDVLKNHSTK